jgi:hypothetical protein
LKRKKILRLVVLASLALSTASLTACVDSGTTYTTGSIDRSVTVFNASGYTIVQFYGSNTGRSSWEEDILGTGVLPSGSAVDINFNDGSGACLFDFKAVFADGSSVVESNIDVCRVSSVTVN